MKIDKLTKEQLKDLANDQSFTSGVFDVEDQDYFGGPGINKSALDSIDDSPAKFMYRFENPQPPTAAMVFGSLVHTMALEPEKFTQRYKRKPLDLNLRTKAGKEEAQAYIDAGLTLVKEEDYRLASDMVEAIRNHSLAHGILSAGLREKAIYRRDIQKRLLKCKPDSIDLERKVIFDLKTSDSVAEKQWRRKFIDFRYFVQAAFYKDQVDPTLEDDFEFIFVVVEKEPPHLIRVERVPDEVIRVGRHEYLRNLDTFSECADRNEWPGFPEQVHDSYIPKWWFN